MSSVDQAGMILYALKTVLQERQKTYGRSSPTASEWRTINDAITATGFRVDAPFSRAGMEEWQSTLESALRIPAE